MVSQQIDIVTNQRAKSAPENAGDPPLISFPEIAMMDKNSVGTSRHSRVEQGLAGSHTRHDTPNLSAAFHLQAIWAIIPVLPGLQQFIQIAQ